MQRSKLDVWVGLFVLLGAACDFVFGLEVSQLVELELSVHLQHHAHALTTLGGLKRQAAVKSAGVVVGRVASVTFDDKTFQATVTMALESQYQISQRQLTQNFDQRFAGRTIHRH